MDGVLGDKEKALKYDIRPYNLRLSFNTDIDYIRYLNVYIMQMEGGN